ncbi:hypothetical protein HMI54_008361 [Coelomomyces lativittatus]|nr:hypothetical protein HMI54_008361 [Coelomomyces lativittatus]
MLNQVLSAINCLYEPKSTTAARNEAQRFLLSLQHYPQDSKNDEYLNSQLNLNSWSFNSEAIFNLAFQCLDMTSNPNVQFFGAQTLYVQFSSSPTLSVEYDAVSQRILSLSNLLYLRSTSPNFVLDQLCLAV